MNSEDFGAKMKKKNLFVIVVALLFIVLVLPTMLRFADDNDALIGSEPYYHIRAARALLKADSLNFFNPPEGISDMSYSPRDYVFNPYHYLLVYSSGIMSFATSSRIVPFLLGVLSILIFNLLLKVFLKEDWKRNAALLFLVMNPAFIYTFTVSNPHAEAIFLSLLGFYLFMKKNRVWFLLSILCLLVVSLFSLFNTILVLLVILAYVLTKDVKKNRFIITVFVLAIFSFAADVQFFYNYTYTPEVNMISNLLSDLGGIIGFDIFSIILAVYGVTSNWKDKPDFVYFFVLSLGLMFSLFFIGNVANMYLSFFIAVAAGMGFVKLEEHEWSVLTVKNLSMLILVCGILFSAVSYMNRLESMYPDKDIVDSLKWMRNNAYKEGYVLSHYDNGYLISALANNAVLTDSLSSSGYNQIFLYKVQDTLFYGRKMAEARQLFETYKIKYVYVTPEMKSGLVWTKPKEGLLFLFMDNSFKKVYDSAGIEIWEFIEKKD